MTSFDTKRPHSGLKASEIDRLSEWDTRSSVPSSAHTAHLISCLATLARFTALIRSFTRSLAHSLTPELMGKRLESMNKTFIQFQPIVGRSETEK